MKEIKIGDKTYEFKAPLSKLNVWLKKKTKGHPQNPKTPAIRNIGDKWRAYVL